jgi:hypothetical protein
MHLDNPGRDIGNVEVDDVLAPKRQGEIELIADALVRFEPTKVALEWPVDRADELAGAYRAYCGDERPLGRSEASQFGFRVARRVGATVHAVDQEDVFWDPAVDEFTARHPELAPYVERFWSQSAAEAEEATAFLAEHTLVEVIREKNSPQARYEDLAAYYEHLIPVGVGADDEYPGAEILAYWYRRNFKIACNLHAVVEDGDRVLMVYGAGHIPVLEHILTLLPGARLTPTLDYLPPAGQG